MGIQVVVYGSVRAVRISLLAMCQPWQLCALHHYAYCKPANRDATQHKHRLKFCSCVTCIASNQTHFSKKACENTEGII